MAEDTLALVAAVNRPNLKLNLDLYHVQIGEGNLIEICRKCLPYIGEIQVADVPGRHEPGSGELNFERLFAAAEQSGYQGWYGAEYRPEGTTSAGLGWMKKYQNRSN